MSNDAATATEKASRIATRTHAQMRLEQINKRGIPTRNSVRRRHQPRGVAATELAVILPVLCFICLVIADYGRIFYALATLSDCARVGALYYATHPTASASEVQTAALTDATNLTGPAPTVAISRFTDTRGNACLKVTASYTFTTISPYPGIPSTTALSRSVVILPNP